MTPELTPKRPEMGDDDAYRARIQAIVDAAPPLTDDQIAKLKILLAPDC